MGDTPLTPHLVSRHAIMINLCTKGMTSRRGRWGLKRRRQFLQGRSEKSTFSDFILTICVPEGHRNEAVLVKTGRPFSHHTSWRSVRLLCSTASSPGISFGAGFGAGIPQDPRCPRQRLSLSPPPGGCGRFAPAPCRPLPGLRRAPRSGESQGMYLLLLLLLITTGVAFQGCSASVLVLLLFIPNIIE